MPLELPKIDDKNYQQILEEALARIPVHNPEWTNFNDSDPGITLIQLFAFMTDNLLYRANLIPERNRIKFLRLLGIPLQPPEPAEGFVTFINNRGPLKTITFSEGLEVYSGQVPFRTVNGLDVLPLEGMIFYKGKPSLSEQEYQDTEKYYRAIYNSLAKPGSDLTLYEIKELKPPSSGVIRSHLDLANDTVDRCLWIALLARSPKSLEDTRDAIANKVLTLGYMPSLVENARAIMPHGVLNQGSQSALIFEIADLNPKLHPSSDDEVKAKYVELPASSTTNLLLKPGLVELQLPGMNSLNYWQNLEPTEHGVGNLPPALEDPSLQGRIITWIRVRRRTLNKSEEKNQLSTKISWVGINAAEISQRLQVFDENIGQGTGEPDQRVRLINTPVIPDSVNLMVDGESWLAIDDLAAAEPEVPKSAGSQESKNGRTPNNGEGNTKAYTLDRESGEIIFGDGLRGKRPPAGSMIQASYAYGGGKQGQVGIGAINKAPRLPAGLQVTNPLPTWGGNEAETVLEAEKRIPGYIRHQDRLVSEEDFKEIALRTPGVDIGRVEVIPLFHPDPDINDIPCPGVVTLLVIPRYDIAQPYAPQPDRLFLEEVCKYLYPRRLVTTELHVRGPEYVPIWISVGIEVIAGMDFAPLREEVKKELKTFLSPLSGGYEKVGWLLSRDVDAEELRAVASRVEGISKINGLQLGGISGPSQTSIPFNGLKLPHLIGVAVQLGDPQNIEDFREGISDLPGEQEGEIVPIPIVPPECTID